MNLYDQLSLFSETDKVEMRNVTHAAVLESEQCVDHAPSGARSKMAQVIHLAHVRLVMGSCTVSATASVSDNVLLSRVLNRSKLF